MKMTVKSLPKVLFGSTPVIENSEPNFRKGWEAASRSGRLNDASSVTSGLPSSDPIALNAQPRSDRALSGDSSKNRSYPGQLWKILKGNHNGIRNPLRIFAMEGP